MRCVWYRDHHTCTYRGDQAMIKWMQWAIPERGSEGDGYKGSLFSGPENRDTGHVNGGGEANHTNRATKEQKNREEATGSS